MPVVAGRRVRGWWLLLVALAAGGLAAIPVSQLDGVAVAERLTEAELHAAVAALPPLESPADDAVVVPDPPVGDSSAIVSVVSKVNVVGDPVPPEVLYTAQGLPPAATAVSPADGAVVTTTTPTLTVNSVTDPDGDPVTYRFKVTTEADAEKGTIVADTRVTTPAFTVPVGSLKDGLTYWWHVYTSDAPSGAGVAPGWVRAFRVDLRLGARGTYPMDQVGPVAVNLSTGNVVVGTSSPAMQTVAGPLGLSYTYNSRTPDPSGLVGSYYNDPNANRVIDSGEKATVIRRDPSIAFDWGTGGPVDGMRTDDFIARWTGFVTSSVTGSLLFGATGSDGFRITVGGAQVLNQWSTQTVTTPAYGSAVSVTAGAPVSITVEMFEATGSASFRLYVKGNTGTSLAESLVPAGWLSADAPGLPRGWSMNPIGGSGLAYVRADVSDSQVVLIGPDGDAHVYMSNGTGYTPPKDEDGVLARDISTGVLTMSARDGIAYEFDAAGTLQSAISGISRPSAHRYTWTTPSGSPLPRLTSITDPVSQRSVTLRYGGDSQCPTPPSGFDSAAPGGMLCTVELWDSTASKLYYSSGRLARIEDPGTRVTDFGYDSSGRLAKVRDPLAADMVATTLRADDDTTRTVIGYDTDGRATSVTLAEPTASAARPGHDIDYTSTTETRVHVDGLTEPYGWFRKLTFDTDGRQLTETDATNRTTSFEWNSIDQLLSTTNAAGLKSTSIYDHVGRVIESYGPSPSAWFGSDRKPLTAYVTQVPKTTAAFDEGMNGLDVTYFNNTTFTGDVIGHSFGVGDSSGAVNATWTTPPVPGIGSNWSARMTGEILLDAAGTYTFRPDMARRAILFIDDQRIVDTLVSPSGTYNNVVAGTRHRMRLELTSELPSSSATFNYTGAAQSWTVPTGVTAVTVDAYGAQGADNCIFGPCHYGGRGGYARATIPVSSTESLQINVGGQGDISTGNGGWNGGGSYYGGGASDVRQGGTALGNRVVVAGGGGGPGWEWGSSGGWNGGAGGGTAGGDASIGGSTGGTQSAGGVYGGTLGQGGVNGGGGGGGGYYGGGGGWTAGWTSIPGGGGSGYVSGTNTTMSSGVRAGNGQVALSWTAGAGTYLRWTPPGSSEALVPGSKLTPRYGLRTSGIDADGKKTVTQYASPQLGLATATIVDPAGLALTSTATYEADGSGFRRQLTRTLPKGSASTVIYAHYGATETRANPCDSGSSSVNQAGLPELTTDADPDAGGSQTPIQRERVYDAAGRVVASRVVGDSAWTCATFDSRGRAVTSTARNGDVSSVDYTTPDTVTAAFKDSGGSTRTTATTVDILGRQLTYTDEWGTVTRPVYDQPGRVTATYRTFSGGSESQVSSASYDAAGRVLTASDHLTGATRTTTYTYDTPGRLAVLTRPNNTTTATTYDTASGRVAGITHTSAPVPATTTFSHTGAAQTWTVPTGVSSVTIAAYGGQGYDGTHGGLGGFAQSTIAVTAGETLQVNVGGQGTGSGAGWNGGGSNAAARRTFAKAAPA